MGVASIEFCLYQFFRGLRYVERKMYVRDESCNALLVAIDIAPYIKHTNRTCEAHLWYEVDRER